MANRTFNRLFIDHPASVGETYFEHMAFAFRFSRLLLMAGCAALVHAFLPFMFETTASRIVRELYERTKNRRPQDEPAVRMETT
jgi:hypothetical protein